jgi:hypothetical protein
VGRIAIALGLLALILDAVAADPGYVLNRSALVEVRTLDGLPREVNTLLGRDKSGLEGIADARKPFNKTDVVDPRLPMRRFIVAGSSLSSVLVAYEQGGIGYSVHAIGFALEPSGWTELGEWTLSENPLTLWRLIDLTSPDRNRARLSMQQRIRASGSRPLRRDAPLREENINAEEVGEIQTVMSSVLPGAIVNIAGVVTGCPCEDGPACSDQVWIVAHRPEWSKGVQLSKISGHWNVGPLQQWWMDYDKLEAGRPKPSNWRAWNDYLAAEKQLNERFPACAKAPTPQ